MPPKTALKKRPRSTTTGSNSAFVQAPKRYNTSIGNFWARLRPPRITDRWIRILSKILRFGAEVMLLASVFWCIAILVFYAASESSGGWELGQIVALTIWVPSFMEWLYASTRKFFRCPTPRWRSNNDCRRTTERFRSPSRHAVQDGCHSTYGLPASAAKLLAHTIWSR